MHGLRPILAAGPALVLLALGCNGGASSGSAAGSTASPAATSPTGSTPPAATPTAASPAAPTGTPVGGPADPAADGPWTTSKVTIPTLTKGLSSYVEVHMPVGTQGPRPVVAICHGWLTTTSLYVSIAEHLATRGFAAALFQQPDIASTSTPDWADQLRGAIDVLFAANGAGGALAGQLDTANLGLIGHSYGGATVIWAGADDTRVKAVVALAPVNQYHWPDLLLHSGRLAVPFNVQAAQNDTLSIPSQYTAPIYDAATVAPAKLYFNVTNGGHMDFCDSGKGTNGNRLSSQYLTAWMEHFLGGIPDTGGFTDGTQARKDLAAGLFCDVR